MEQEKVLHLREDEMSWREIEGEIVVLDLKADKYLSINASGAGLWKLLAAGSTRPQLLEMLKTTYGLDAEVAEKDTDAFLEMLEERELLR